MLGHTPVRECILCRKKTEKSKLLKVVKNKEGIFLDKLQNKEGRGAYICEECRKKEELFKKKALDRSFHQKVPEDVYDLLKGDNNG